MGNVFGECHGPCTSVVDLEKVYMQGNQNPKSKNIQHNCQKKKYKRTDNGLQNIHIKPGGEIRCSGRVGSSFFTSIC